MPYKRTQVLVCAGTGCTIGNSGELIEEFEKEINKKMPGVVLSTGTQYWFYNPKLKNFVPRSYDNWWFFILDAYIEE